MMHDVSKKSIKRYERATAAIARHLCAFRISQTPSRKIKKIEKFFRLTNHTIRCKYEKSFLKANI